MKNGNDFIELSSGKVKNDAKHTDRVQAPEKLLGAFGEETGYVRFVFFEQGPIFDGNFNANQLIGALGMALSCNAELLETFKKGVALADLISETKNSFVGEASKEFAVGQFQEGNKAAQKARAKRASEEEESKEPKEEPGSGIKGSGFNFSLGEA